MNAPSSGLPAASLSKFRGVNPNQMTLFWDGNTMVLV
jgi:hypothetical protein